MPTEDLRAKAIELKCRAHEAAKQLLGESHPESLSLLNSLAIAHLNAGRGHEAVGMLKSYHELCSARLGPNHPSSIASLCSLALAHRSSGGAEPSIQAFQEAIPLLEAAYSTDHTQTCSAKHNLAGILVQEGRFDEAEPILRDLLPTMKKLFGENSRNVVATEGQLLHCLAHDQRYAEAARLTEEMYRQTQHLRGNSHFKTVRYLHLTVQLHIATGDNDKAKTLAQEFLQQAPEDVSSEYLDGVILRAGIASALIEEKSYSDAIRELNQAIESINGPACAHYNSATLGVPASTSRERSIAEWRSRGRRLLDPKSLRHDSKVVSSRVAALSASIRCCVIDH